MISIQRILIIVSLLFCALSSAIAESRKDDSKLITYYVSSSDGSDDNDGLTQSTAKASIRSISKKENVCIRLKKGDLFFERFKGYKNTIIESYGTGHRPVICGLKFLSNNEAWENIGGRIWMLDLSKESDFYGYLMSSGSNKSTVNNVGAIYDIENDKVYGHLVNQKDALVEDGDFYMTGEHKLSYFTENPFSKIYFKYSQDPRKVRYWAFTMYDIGINSMRNCTIRDIAVVGFSWHGIANCSGCLIENCQIDLIGGATFVRDRDPWCRFGNGIEFSTSNFDNTVTNCIISRTYDCATTIQGNPKESVLVRNIHFKDNKIYHCRQAFEHYINTHGVDNGSSYEDCSFENNVCYEMGVNEFSSPGPMDANLLSYENSPKNIKIQNNIFFGAPYLCGYVFDKGLKNNRVYIYSGQYLNHYHGYSNYPTINANKKSDIADLRQRTKDDSKIIILKRDSHKAESIGKKIKSRINWKPVDLHVQ